MTRGRINRSCRRKEERGDRIFSPIESRCMENVREVFVGNTLGAYEARIAGSNKLNNSWKGGCANLIVEIQRRGVSRGFFFTGVLAPDRFWKERVNGYP